MISSLKNIALGLVLSYLGSLPMGYLNLVGYQVYQKSGWESMAQYLLGVVVIEMGIIYVTFRFAQKLITYRKLHRALEALSAVFMVVLAVVFFTQPQTLTAVDFQQHATPLLLGILLSGVNIIQLPFWTGWNLWLLQKEYLVRNRVVFYIVGAGIGTFLGMLTLILALDFFASQFLTFSRYLFTLILPLFFFAMGSYQGIAYWRKYYNTTV